jgi:Cft2 family RNA processing exonuclease
MPYESGKYAGKALVVVPGFQNILEARGKDFRLAYVSGWAALDNARARSSAEVLIPYSDHAGFDELLAIVEQTGAREIDVVHGYAEPFAHILRLRGLDARAPREAAARAASDEVIEG